MIKTVFLVSLALACTMSFQFNLRPSNGDKVKIDFYYESLCPYCTQFMSRSLKTAMQTKDFWKICDFSLYPYGNARRTANGSSWSFQCQHGVRQCQGNFIENCAIRKNEGSFYEKVLPFVICLESGSSDWIGTGKRCAATYKLNWDEIFTCSTGEDGIKYTVDTAIATEKLDPAHKYVPWVVVNDGHTSSSESGVISNMVKYVCSIYRGPEKIAACP